MNEQPRVPAGSPKGGQWASQGGTQSESEWTSASDYFGSAVDSRLRRFRSARAAVAWLDDPNREGMQAKSLARHPFPVAKKPAWLGRSGKVEDKTVSLKDLQSEDQITVSLKHVREYLVGRGATPGRPIDVVAVDDKFTIDDGYHRAVAAWMAGEDSIEVKARYPFGEWGTNPPKR